MPSSHDDLYEEKTKTTHNFRKGIENKHVAPSGGMNAKNDKTASYINDWIEQVSSAAGFNASLCQGLKENESEKEMNVTSTNINESAPEIVLPEEKSNESESYKNENSEKFYTEKQMYRWLLNVEPIQTNCIGSEYPNSSIPTEGNTLKPILHQRAFQRSEAEGQTATFKDRGQWSFQENIPNSVHDNTPPSNHTTLGKQALSGLLELSDISLHVGSCPLKSTTEEFSHFDQKDKTPSTYSDVNKIAKISRNLEDRPLIEFAHFDGKNKIENKITNSKKSHSTQDLIETKDSENKINKNSNALDQIKISGSFETPGKSDIQKIEKSDINISKIDRICEKCELCTNLMENTPKTSTNPFSSDLKDNSNKKELCICNEKINQMQQEIQFYKEKILQMSSQMAHQAQYIDHLRRSDRHKSPPCPDYPNMYPGGLNNSYDPYNRPSSNNSHSYSHVPFSSTNSTNSHSCSIFSPKESSTTNSHTYGYEFCSSDTSRLPTNSHLKNGSSGPNLCADNINLTQLMNQLISLRLENSNLTSSLEKEKKKRKDAEVNFAKDQDYINRLENSLKTLHNTRIIVDPETYKNVADNYMASRVKSTRNPITHSGCSNQDGDLVCDRLTHLQQENENSNHRSSSCPTTPPRVNRIINARNQHIESCKTPPPASNHPHRHLYRTISLDNPQNSPPPKEQLFLFSSPESDINTKSINPGSISPTADQINRSLANIEYEKLLDSLKNLQKSDTR